MADGEQLVHHGLQHETANRQIFRSQGPRASYPRIADMGRER